MSELSDQVGELLRAQDLQTAARLIESARNASPLSAEVWVLQSRLALALGNPEAALGAVQYALKITPDFPLALYQMAYVCRAQSDVAGALDWYAQAFLQHPVLGDSLGWCHAMVLGFARYEQAMPIAAFWTVQRPDEAAGWFMYGTCRLAMRQPAWVELLQAWALDESIVDLPNNLGGAYLMVGDLAQAGHWLGIALARQPTDENTLSNVALLRQMSVAQWV